MIVNIQIDDELYAAMLQSKTRVEGSLGLVSPTEGNFNAYRRNAKPRGYAQVLKLPHGRATLTDEEARLYLRADRVRLGDSLTGSVILVESMRGSEFIKEMLLS